MTTLSEIIKVDRVNKAFSKLVSEYIAEDRGILADKVVKMFNSLPGESKARLYDILSDNRPNGDV